MRWTLFGLPTATGVSRVGLGPHLPEPRWSGKAATGRLAPPCDTPETTDEESGTDLLAATPPRSEGRSFVVATGLALGLVAVWAGLRAVA